MYAAMSESWPGSGIVVHASYKKQGFEECLGNVMTFNSLLMGTRIHILESRNTLLKKGCYHNTLRGVRTPV